MLKSSIARDKLDGRDMKVEEERDVESRGGWRIFVNLFNESAMISSIFSFFTYLLFSFKVVRLTPDEEDEEEVLFCEDDDGSDGGEFRMFNRGVVVNCGLFAVELDDDCKELYWGGGESLTSAKLFSFSSSKGDKVEGKFNFIGVTFVIVGVLTIIELEFEIKGSTNGIVDEVGVNFLSVLAEDFEYFPVADFPAKILWSAS